MNERRKFSRILFDTRANLDQPPQSWGTRILDLSLNGALVEEPRNFAPLGDRLTLSFTLPESDIELQMEAEIIHRKLGLLGLKCLHIDVESISHLRRMLELNLGDANLLYRELERFIEEHEQAADNS
ncbi:PilZ domain-containing protein [Shewanella cyperi]|uniref:PilZ domain-containing protein n=1 Tax=Shewanella cyperi TaxID=2814292 RepID=UPI001A94A8B2|nr:PilZ domain-containing protein [Shewanella cyperi]QSX41692.1 PilZ domain-containing protein [Shewanella cyperi]